MINLTYESSACFEPEETDVEDGGVSDLVEFLQRTHDRYFGMHRKVIVVATVELEES